MKKKAFRFIAAAAVFLLAFCVVFGALVWNGVILLNGYSASRYPVKGVDVSSYQGKVDWQTLSSQNLSFAFIKATEGSSFVDPCFAYNYKEAQKTDLAVGAYHFFSYDSAGQTQAEHFIQTVAPYNDMLPPVVDLEFYGDKEKNPPKRDEVEAELQAMLDALEGHYKRKPILYATEKSYESYLSGGYEAYDIWIRNVLAEPTLSDKREWKFWQFTNRARLDGYEGKEKFIDINVFRGSTADFRTYWKGGA